MYRNVQVVKIQLYSNVLKPDLVLAVYEMAMEEKEGGRETGVDRINSEQFINIPV